MTALQRSSSSALAAITPRTIDVLREQIAPAATDAELAYFAQVCNRLNLSPFADQLVLIGRYDSRLKRVVHRHQITVAGRRALAQRTGRLARIDGPVWCGPRDPRTRELLWSEVWDDDETPPYCARVLIFVHGVDGPAANGTAKWSEFAQYDSSGKLLPLWRRMPAHMLGKVAESLALRRAFPDVLDPVTLTDLAEPPPVTFIEPDGDDRAEILEANGAPPDPDPFDLARFRETCERLGLTPEEVSAEARIYGRLEDLTGADRPALFEALDRLRPLDG